jgi:predicted metalloprotease with PDZ domain
MDDFARAFFGTGEGDWGVKTYDMAELTRALNAVAPYDWASFLHDRLTGKAAGAPLGGFARSGYVLAYSDMPTPFFRDAERRGKEMNLSFSLGLTVGKAGKVESIIWGGPAFVAGMTTAAEIIAVNGATYGDDILKTAIIAAKGGTAPIRLTIKTGERVRDVSLIWAGGLRYPRLVKTGTAETGLDLLLKAR